MQIGFDAQMAFSNGTGLGHYSRTLLYSLAELFPQYHFHLFTKEVTDRVVASKFSQVTIHAPNATSTEEEKEFWMQHSVTDLVQKFGIKLYHGLSHELPQGLASVGCKAIVTVHDLLHERYPEIFTPQHHQQYTQKLHQACRNADLVLAISEATKADFEQMYQVPTSKISVAVQSCNPAFYKESSTEHLAQIRAKYQLPQRFYLYVSNILSYKNLLLIVQAMAQMGEKALPLVVLGNGTVYKQTVVDFISSNALEGKVHFVSDMEVAQTPEFRNAIDLPAIYLLATCLIYPSFFEGWGIPVLEAMCAKLPVFASNTSSIPEVGGDTIFYFNPHHSESLVQSLQNLHNTQLCSAKVAAAFERSKLFTAANCAKRVNHLYTSLQ